MTDPLAQAFADAALVLKRYAFVLIRRHDATRAADLVQDTLLRGWEKRHLYRPEAGALEAWLCTIMRNLFVSSMRRARLERELETAGPFWAREHRICQAHQFDEVYLREVQRIAGEIDDSGVLSLRTAGAAYVDIQGRLGVPAGTIKSRISRGRATLERMCA